jgi:hypothetical protein
MLLLKKSPFAGLYDIQEMLWQEKQAVRKLRVDGQALRDVSFHRSLSNYTTRTAES